MADMYKGHPDNGALSPISTLLSVITMQRMIKQKNLLSLRDTLPANCKQSLQKIHEIFLVLRLAFLISCVLNF